MDDSQVFLSDLALLPNPAQPAGANGIFGDQSHPAGLAIQPIDQLRMRALTEVKANAADQAGKLIRFCGMTHQPSRFVDDQQFRVFVKDMKEFFHSRPIALIR
jgi:hypothetical protein